MGARIWNLELIMFKLSHMISAVIILSTVSQAKASQHYQAVIADPVLEPWRWRSYPELQGVGPQCMVEDKDGNLWFGTDEGVRRYDGVNWTVFTPGDGLVGTPVTVLCATRDGVIYAGSEEGISRFSNGEWARIFPSDGDVPLPIYDLMEASDRSLWVATKHGAFQLQGEKWTSYTTESLNDFALFAMPGVKITLVPDEMTLVSHWGSGIGALVLPTKDGLKRIVKLVSGGPGENAGLKVGDRILKIDGTEPRGRALFGPVGTSVRLTVQRESQTVPLEVPVIREQIAESFRDFPVFDVFEDLQGSIWFGLSHGDIVRYHPESRSGKDSENSFPSGRNKWKLYIEDDGLDIGPYPRIAQTPDGSIWTFSTATKRGLNRFQDGFWINIRLGSPVGDHRYTSILGGQDGTLWVGGFGTLNAFRDGAWKVYHPPDVPVPSIGTIELFETSDGALWVISRGQEATRLDYRTPQWATYEGLAFQCETPDGARWFLTQDNGVVHLKGENWILYGVEDGLMDAPTALIATKAGVLWAAGSNDKIAATARFDGVGWSLQTHPRLSWGIHPSAVYESSDGSLWFGATRGWRRMRGQRGGVLRFNGNMWVHYTPPWAPVYLTAIAETPDGIVWFGGDRLYSLNKQSWNVVSEPEEVSTTIEDVKTDLNGDLWVGTRAYGIFHRKGGVWSRYDVRDGIAANGIKSILPRKDGSIWAGTEKGISRFDGRTWTTHVLPKGLSGYILRESSGGSLWINNLPLDWVLRARDETSVIRGAYTIGTTRYKPDEEPPETDITVFQDRVSQPGNTIIYWKGTDAWRATPDEELQYAWRLDEGDWSPFSSEESQVFFSLPGGDHSFEVRARDRDFNVDPTPASVRFTVVPPAWRSPWFLGLMVILLAGIGFQTGRVIRRGWRLQESNLALSGAYRQIQEANRLKSQFLANMSHELRTPMNSIIGFTNLVLRRGADSLSERHRDNLTKVKMSADHLLNLINDILDLSKIEAGRMDIKPESFDVKNLIASCCASVSPIVKPGVKLNYEVQEGVEAAYTDEARLRQIVINLLSNAIKFTEQGEVSVCVYKDGESDGDPSMMVRVSDTGIGIPGDAVDYIFDEFRQVDGSTTRRYQGTGLGLSITKKFTELLGGAIDVESQEGKGSTFTVRIPVNYRGGEAN